MEDKGRKFRKINIIDLLIIFIIIAAGLFVFNKFGKARVLTPFKEQDKMRITFWSESLPEYAVDAIRTGDVVQDKITTAVFGKVIKTEKGRDIDFRPGVNGEIVKSSKEGYCSLLLTVEGEGVDTPTGTTFGNNDYFIYKYVEIKIGKTFAYARIKSIDKVAGGEEP